MNESQLMDAIIIGGGHAGLSVGYYLKKHGLKHLILERGKIGESWRAQRWDSFRFNTPNKFNALAGDPYQGDAPDGFATADGFVSMLEGYANRFELPVLEYTKVISVEKDTGSGYFNVAVLRNNLLQEFQSRQVVVASGIANKKKFPPFANELAGDIKQLHTSEYRKPAQLPDGAVLVVGGAQSGVQIAEDLVNAGRKVFLSTSMVARIPRFYRGRDCMDWLSDMKFFDVRAEDIPDPVMLNLKPPQITGIGDGKQTISLQALAKKGVIILGKMNDANGMEASFDSNAAAHVKFADEFSAKVKKMIDEFIIKTGLSAPLPSKDEADMPDHGCNCASNITSLNLQKENVSTIIWTTGFTTDHSYIKSPVFNENGSPLHKDGSSPVDGLYFMGLHFLRTRKSAIIFGIKQDAEFIASNVVRFARGEKANIQPIS